MGADAQSDVERLAEFNLEGATGCVQRLSFGGHGHGDVIALFFDSDPSRRGDIRLDFTRRTAGVLTVLKRREAITVDDGVGVRRVGLQTLANQQTRFAVGIAARADPANVRRERDLARHFFPDEMKCIVGEPHIFSSTGDEISLFRRIIFDRAGPEDVANVAVALERSER